MVGIITGFYHEAYSKIIRLQFLVPAIFHAGVLSHHIGYLGEGLVAASTDQHTLDEALDKALAGTALCPMSVDDVADFMTQNTGQLVFIF